MGGQKIKNIDDRKYKRELLLHVIDKIRMHIEDWRFYEKDIEKLLEIEKELETRIPESPGIDPYLLSE